MGWIKRNLFFVIGLVGAVLLLAAAGFYDFASWRNNQDALQKLNEIATTIQQDQQNKYLSEDNIQAARDQQKQVDDWIAQARDYFQPIAPIPNPPSGQVTSEMFAPALSSTVKELQREADDASVQLPPQYYFSFTAESDKAVFDPTTLGALAQQLGEVKAIVQVLYNQRVNGLESIQRVPLAKDDVGGSPGDYLTDQPITTDQAVMMPYQVTFRGFSSDIANVLTAFATSPHEFIVRTVSVQPASASTVSGGAGYNGGEAPEGNPAANLPAAPEMTMPMPSRGGLQTVLNEQMLRVTMEIEVVKLTSAGS